LKSFRNPAMKIKWLLAAGVVTLTGIAVGIALTARGDISEWLQNIEATTPAENALFRLMDFPGGSALAPRPPQEARPLLDALVQAQPARAELYSLRAMTEEQQLDFDAAEKDWKSYAQAGADRTASETALADFYHRRGRAADEAASMMAVAQLPSTGSDALLAAQRQQSWLAFSRIFGLISDNALPSATSDAAYRAWIARYPQEPSVYPKYLEFLLSQKQYDQAGALITAYAKAFPDDAVFPVKAQALLEYRKGDVQARLAAYDRSFQPLWPAELVQGYFGLMNETHSLRKFLDASQAAWHANPDDLNAMARIFYCYQQEGKNDAAEDAIEEFRTHKETTGIAWKGDELFTLARLLEQVHDYPEAARYYYALYNATDAPDNRSRALVGLTNILLTSPDEPLRLGAGDLSMYKDIATADTGPGFLNGILSLLMNSEDPAASFAEEEQKSIPYFHREEAARLLAMLDQQYPQAPERAALHAQLMQAYVNYGENDAVIAAGKKFLQDFPDSPQRTQVSLLMADAYARLGRTSDEFAIYDAALSELARKAQNVPLGSALASGGSSRFRSLFTPDAEDAQDSNDAQAADDNAPTAAQSAAFAIDAQKASSSAGARSAEYDSVLERYLARLAALKQVPQALEVLRHEVDRNPNDPGLYERLAQFLQQNQLGAQQEEIYQRAIQQFPDRSWYQKLARLYLRERRADQFEQLANQVVTIFAGSELADYFNDVVARNGFIGPQLYLRLNLYANQRFPHNPVFIRNLLNAYRSPGTANGDAWASLLSRHWFEEEGLRDEYFEYLSRTNQLDAQLDALRSANPDVAAGQWQRAAQTNPVAVRFYSEAQLWQSHFENGMPSLGALANEFPADADLGRRASSVYRSLAYVDAQNTDAAVRVELNLSKSDPTNRDTLARIGDIYADRGLFAQAAPYWNQMAEIEPGKSDSYLEAATVYWDYYKFDDALRLLNLGRTKLGDDNLFSYEEGAIYENERDYPRAIARYVNGALAGGENSQSLDRLLDLARRPSLKAEVDRQTAQIVDAQHPAIAPIRLRVKILEAQDRKADMRAMLLDAIGRTDSLELAEQIEAIAQQESLEDVRQRAIEQQAALTSDPVHRLELRYALVQFFESKKDVTSAQKNVEALYQENPKVLGVVRATVDFYWRQKMQQRAVDVLTQAAKDSYPALADRFSYEASRKATDMENFSLARQLLDPLLQKSPYDAEFLAAMADTYGRQNDSAGLRDFYVAKIALFRQAPFAADERTTRIAELRRGLIPALTQLKDYAGGTDQYIELINEFPEDNALTTEAALYAEKYNLQPRLTAYYTKTVSDSPRDYRWPMVLARLQTQFEDYPSAIASYGKSIAIRPDRTDLYAARADLRERLMQFDDAAADYTKLYDLSYHDPKWMISVAEMRARQAKAAETVEALNIALITGKPVSPQNFFQAAQSLESWGFLAQARDFAQRGVDAAGGDLLANPSNLQGAQLYVRVLTRMRQDAAAYNTLDAALRSAHAPVTSLSPTIQQVERQGIAAVTDAEWRRNEQESRSRAGDEGMDACMKEMGAAVEIYFTPEEQSAFSTFLVAKQSGTPSDDLIDAAEAAHLSDLESRWRFAVLMASGPRGSGELQRLIELQSQRLKYVELAGQLEQYAASVPWTTRSYVLTGAADAYRAAGDSANELRIYSELDANGRLGEDDQRYFELLLAQQPQKLVALAGQDQTRWYDAATNFTIANGSNALAYSAIRTHGAAQAPMWAEAYLGLAGLYFADPSADVNSAFRDILNDRTIGERIGKPVDLKQQLAGDVWFYYGSRYGEYLGVTHQGVPEDYLPAALEQSPGSAGAYLVTADYYADAGDSARAIADYQHSLDLNADQPSVLDHIAVLYSQQGRQSQAIAEWKLALAQLKKEEERRAVPDNFWNDFASVAQHVGQRKLTAQFHPTMDSLLREYIRHNGSYNTLPLLRAAYSMTSEPSGVAWLLDLSAAAASPQDIVSQLMDADWISQTQREPFYARMLSLQQAAVDKNEGEDKEAAQAELHRIQVNWIAFLVDTKQYQRAKDAFDALPEETRTASAGDLAPLELRIVVKLNALDPLLATYRDDPDHAPSLETLQSTAAVLQADREESAAREILEFAYSREIARHNLDATNFLGLGEIRLESGDTRGALELLNRLVLVVGQPFENLDAAASLLEKTHHPAEAAAFLGQMAQATPWRPEYRLRLARARLAADSGSANERAALVAMAASQDFSYALRSEAAVALGGRAADANLGSRELTLLASGGAISPEQANQPYFTHARILAASHAATAPEKIAILLAALEDDPSANEAHLQLFQAAAAAREYQLAYSAAGPFRDSVDGPVGEAQTATANNEDEATSSVAAARSALDVSSDGDRLRIASELATITENLNLLDDSIRYLQTAEKLESDSARAAVLRSRLVRLNNEISRRAKNAARQPQIHNQLEQDHLVRPRLATITPAERSQP